MIKEITKNTTIGECLRMNIDAEEVFMGFGMHCLSCPMSQMETIEEACQVHGVDPEFMIKKLNENANFSVKGSLKSNQKLKRGKKS